MDVNTVEELRQHFLKRLSIFSRAVLLSCAIVDQSYVEMEDSLMEVLDNMVFELKSLRWLLDCAKEQLHNLQNLKVQCHDLLQCMLFVSNNVPLKLPVKKFLQIQPAFSDRGKIDQKLKAECLPTSRSCGFLDFLTVDEFEAVPRYMKGRLTYQKVNAVIEQIDRVFMEKYKIMKQRTASLNEVHRKQVEAFRLQENKDTEGLHFILAKDISELSSLKVDSDVRNILTILRHCNLLREIRGGGCVRFAINSRF